MLRCGSRAYVDENARIVAGTPTFIKVAAPQTTGWTKLRAGRYRCGMSRRRHDYDPLAGRVRPHWLEMRDAQGQVLECAALPLGADLRAAMAETIARLTADGWRIEGDALYYKPLQAQSVVENLVAGA